MPTATAPLVDFIRSPEQVLRQFVAMKLATLDADESWRESVTYGEKAAWLDGAMEALAWVLGHDDERLALFWPIIEAMDAECLAGAAASIANDIRNDARSVKPGDN